MNIAVLDAKTLGDDISLDAIKKQGNLTVYENTLEGEVIDRIKNQDVVIVNKIKLTSTVLEKANSLKLICVAATGYDNIDIKYCKDNNIAVCNVEGYSSFSVCQLTVSMVLSLSVNLKSFSKFVEDGSYTKSGIANKLKPVYHELYGKTWGIIGYGNIGKEVKKVAEALGCKVIVNKRMNDESANCVSLEKLCKDSDIITIHTPLNDETKGMIDEKMISIMKKDVILVNTARGAVTDEKAISDAVINKKIGAFGTDVYSVEPFSKDHPFYKIKEMDNVCLTPHMAWGSFEARERCIKEIAENIEAFKNKKIRNRIDLY